MTLAILCITTGCLGLFVMGLFLGYRAGVREMEERWSETVQKADWVMRYGDPRTLDGRKYGHS